MQEIAVFRLPEILHSCMLIQNFGWKCSKNRCCGIFLARFDDTEAFCEKNFVLVCVFKVVETNIFALFHSFFRFCVPNKILI